MVGQALQHLCNIHWNELKVIALLLSTIGITAGRRRKHGLIYGLSLLLLTILIEKAPNS